MSAPAIATIDTLESEPAAAASPASCSLLPAASRLSQLRRRIELITAIEPADPSSGLGTGIPELDAVLSHRGLPRGRLTEVTGARGSGKATLLRRMAVETISRGLGVAYVDASRTLAPRDWAGVVGVAGDAFWVVRPKQASRGAWCADVLLRSGAFGLEVVDGAPVLARSVAVRLIQLAREADAALVVMGEGRIRQAAPPVEIYRHPADSFVANFIGTTNLIPLRAGQLLGRPWPEAAGEGTVSIRPEDVRLTLGAAGPVTGRVAFVRDLGATIETFVEVEGLTLTATTSPRERQLLAIGDTVAVELPPDACVVLKA